MKRRSVVSWLFAGAVVCYVALCIFIYFQWVVPWIAGIIDSRIGADSDRYWQAAELARSSQGLALITFGGNFLGPVTLANLLGDGFEIMCFNFFLFALTLNIGWSIPQINKPLFGFLILLNFELIPALTTLNKEIFALLAGVWTAKYICSEKRSWFSLFAVLAVSIFTRWEQAAILLLYLLLTRLGLRKHPWFTLGATVAIITIMYPYTYQWLGDLSFLLEGATTLIWIDNIQKAFGFPLTVIPKIFMEITGNLHSPQFYDPGYWWKNFQLDPQNMLFLPLGCLAFSIALFYAIRTRRMALDRPIPFFIALTLIISAIPLFTQPRYVYGAYAMLCIELARPKPLVLASRPESIPVFEEPVQA